MVETALKDTHLGGTTPTELQKEDSSCQKIYYDKETKVMVNQSVNEFYTRVLFKSDSLSQDIVFLLDISAKLFNNLRPDAREFFISEGVQVTLRLPTETNQKGNQRLLLVRNIAVELEK